MEILKQSLPNILGGLAVIAIVSVGGWMWSRYPGNAADQSRIVSPSHGGSVPHLAEFSGTYSADAADKDIWLVVQPIQSPRYHPQPSRIPTQSNHQWQTVAYIGRSRDENIGEEFIVHLVAANDAASNVFLEYLKDAAEAERWNGLDGLPKGATTLHSITIVRK